MNKQNVHMTLEIVNSFIDFYYNNLNNKNINNILYLFKDNTNYTFQGTLYKGTQNIFNILQFLINKNIKFNIVTKDISNCGNRRANLLICGNIQMISTGKLIPFIDYIHFGYCKKNNYWIPSVISRIMD